MRAASRPPGAIALPSRFNFPCGAPCRLLYLTTITGDYSQGVVRSECSNPDCKYEFSEEVNERFLLALIYRQFVFTFPKRLKSVFSPQSPAMLGDQPAPLCHFPAVLRQSG